MTKISNNKPLTKIPNNKPVYDLEERTFQFAKGIEKDVFIKTRKIKIV
jgi:hypothetical protein